MKKYKRSRFRCEKNSVFGHFSHSDFHVLLERFISVSYYENPNSENLPLALESIS